jgi:hypothetical protein
VITRDFWSLHPLALLETVSLHLYGDYYTSASLAVVPWMPLVNSGREPFFFSIYYGVPLLTLALFGLLAGGARRWTLFWTGAAVVSLVLAFGKYTPVYAFLRDHLPLLGSFRFPVKYLIVVSMAVAAGAAAGWDALVRRVETPEISAWIARSRIGAGAFAAGIGVLAYAAAGACLYLTTPAAFRFFGVAKSLGAGDPVEAAAFMLRTIPQRATAVLLISGAAAALIFVASSARREAPAARYALYVLIVGDLLVRAWGINPVLDSSYLAQPEWLSRVGDTSEWRFYFGGKQDGTLDPADIDGSRAFLNPPGLIGSAGRAGLNGQALFYPSAWHAREMLSYDLAVLWPRVFEVVTRRFFSSGREARDRFLDRTATRYRILSPRAAAGHRPLMAIPYFAESFLFDWGADTPTRVSIVPDVRVVPDVDRQIDALFEPGWDSRTTAIVERRPAAGGESRPPVTPYARIVEDEANRVRVRAGTGAQGGYLVLLDSYSDDWRASVDGQPAAVVRANALFRAVSVAPGEHIVEFIFRPKAFLWGAAVSAAACLMLIALTVVPARPVEWRS